MSCQYAKISCEEDKLKACCDSWIDELYGLYHLLQKMASEPRDRPSVTSVIKDPDYDYFLFSH